MTETRKNSDLFLDSCFFLIFQTKLFNILTMCSPQQFAELGMLNLYLTNIPTINHPDDEIRESTRK